MVLTVLHKYRMLDKDPAMFFLPLELCDSNPSEKGLTKKTLVLDMDSRLVEFSSRTLPPSTFLTPACGEG